MLASCVSCLFTANEACSAIKGCVGRIASFLRVAGRIGHHNCLGCGHRGTSIVIHRSLVYSTVYSLLSFLGVKCKGERGAIGPLRGLSIVSRGGGGRLRSFVV